MVEKIEIPKHWKRREEILQIIESIGTVHVSKTELAKKYKVSVEQIRKDFIALSDRIAKIDKKELTFKAHLLFEFAINELLKIARNEKQKPMDKVKAILALLQAVDKKIDGLIKLGLIKPAEEQINLKHSADSELSELVVKVARKIRKRKSAGRGSPEKP